MIRVGRYISRESAFDLMSQGKVLKFFGKLVVEDAYKPYSYIMEGATHKKEYFELIDGFDVGWTLM